MHVDACGSSTCINDHMHVKSPPGLMTTCVMGPNMSSIVVHQLLQSARVFVSHNSDVVCHHCKVASNTLNVQYYIYSTTAVRRFADQNEVAAFNVQPRSCRRTQMTSSPILSAAKELSQNTFDV